MSQNENPYASPSSPHEPLPTRVVRKPSRWPGVFLKVDAVWSLLLVVMRFPGLLWLLFVPAGTKTSWILGVAFLFCSRCIGLLAFAMVMREKKGGLYVAYIAGIFGIIPLLLELIYLAENGIPRDETLLIDFLFEDTIRAVWSVAYIFAARAFTKKSDAAILGQS